MRCILWPRDNEAARMVQEQLRRSVVIRPLRKSIRRIAGVDAAFTCQEVIAVASVFSYPSMDLIEEAHVTGPLSFPYVPGYLSFREGHAILKALGMLKRRPDLILVDGQGIAHSRGLGIASHLGVLLHVPSIGCAKSRLIGEFKDPPKKRGSWSPLIYRGKLVGAVLRTRDGVKPLFVSPGHLINLEDSIEIVLGSLGRFRIPEPIRRADHMSKVLVKRIRERQ